MKIHHFFAALLCGALPLVYGCSNEDSPEIINEGSEFAVSFSLGVGGNGSTVSRSVTNEVGLTGEQAVNDVTIVIYDRPINSTIDGKICKVLRCTSPTKSNTTSSLDASYYISYYPYSDVLNTVVVGENKVVTESEYNQIQISDVHLSDLEVGTRYYAMAFANFGTSLNPAVGSSMSAFKDMVYTGALCDPALENNAHKMLGYTNFRMSAINELSFIWKAGSDGKIDLCPNGSKFLVQRLAARLDVSFGTMKQGESDVYDFFTSGSGENSQVCLRIYNNETGVNYGKPLKNSENKDILFYLTSIELVNARTTSSGIYLLERSKAQTASAPAIYLDNEHWDKADPTYATKTVVTAPNPDYSVRDFLTYTGHTTLWNFISSGNINNQRSLMAYMTENVNSDNATVLRIKGYTAASTKQIFTAKSRDSEIPEGSHEVTAEIPIRHSIPGVHHDANPMLYGVVRNTIYRIGIKVYASEGLIYFRYYYYGNLDTDLPTSPYTVTGFDKNVGEIDDQTGTITPNA